MAPWALVMLSAISYNLYLWHLEIIVWVHNTGIPAAATFAIAVPVALGVATALTYGFERPILNGHFASWFEKQLNWDEQLDRVTGYFRRWGRQRLRPVDERQRLAVECIEAGALVDGGGHRLAVPVHRKAQIDDALLTPDLRHALRAFELL